MTMVINSSIRSSRPEMKTAVRAYSIWTRCQSAVFPLISAILLPAPAVAADTTPLFSNDWLIEATIEAPFNNIMRKRSEDIELEGMFNYSLPEGNQQQLNVKVRVRGKFRARKEVCDFAPLRLNFKKKQVKGTEFRGQDKLKLVTHCDNSGKKQDQLVLKEYLTYRFLAALTDNSFRTRLLRITYVDSAGRSKTRTKYAFLIEHKDQLADRVHARLAKVEAIEFDELDHIQTNLVTVFSYFIGNTDFSAVRGPNEGFCCHNILLLEQTPGLKLPIPYDFDFSGMVNAPYAAPNPRFHITTVKTRLYRGLCRNNELLESTFALFQTNRDAFYALIESLEGLSNKSKKAMTGYVNNFYKDLDNNAQVDRKFVTRCSEATAPPSPS